MVLHGIDHLLRMFDAHTQGKRFRFDEDAFLIQHLKNIARRMSGSENDMLCIE